MTFREWTHVYGGTYSTISLVAIAVSTALTATFAEHSLWRYLVIGLPAFLLVHFGLSALAWQFTEHRRRPGAEHDPAGE